MDYDKPIYNLNGPQRLFSPGWWSNQWFARGGIWRVEKFLRIHL